MLQAQNIPSTWTGLYGGVNLGGVFNHATLSSNHFGLIEPSGTCDGSTNFSSFFPGVQGGYLFALKPKFIVGVEGDFTYNVNPSGEVNCNCPNSQNVGDNYAIKNRLQGSIRGRVGYLAKPKLMPFVSAGASFSDLTTSYRNEGGDLYSMESTQPGWLVGGGVEWTFKPLWSLRAEYYYIDYSRAAWNMPTIYGLYDAEGRTQFDLSNNNIRLAINHWF